MSGPTPMRRIETGLPTLDEILGGGLMERSLTVVAGQPGAGKTVLTHQILYNNLPKGRTALYITTMAEPSVKMVRYMQTFSFTDVSRVGQTLHYLDIGDDMQQGGVPAADEKISDALKRVRPSFVVVDSFKAIDRLSGDTSQTAEFAHRLAVRLAAWNAGGFFVGEYSEAEMDQPIFTVADTVMFLKNSDRSMYRQRYIEVHKLRGGGYLGGMHPYEISGDGIKVSTRIKTPEVPDQFPTSTSRVPSGVDAFDRMLDGGLQSATATMIAGGSGTGKTLTALHFAVDAARRGERTVFVSFQENPLQLDEIGRGFGWDLANLKSRGLIEHLYRTPVEIQADIYFHTVLEAARRGGTKLVVVDSMKDIESVAHDSNRYRDFLYSLVNELKADGITVLMTNEIPELFGPFQFSDNGVSFITDTIILLRYVELSGRMTRAVNVMKMRGSEHSKDIREFRIGTGGIEVMDPITAYSGVMTGIPSHSEQPALRHLPGEARFILETLRRNGPSTVDELVDATSFDEPIVRRELGQMEQQGLVLMVSRDGRDLYRGTV